MTDEPILGVHTVGLHASAQDLSLTEVFPVPDDMRIILSGTYVYQDGWVYTRVRVEKKSLETQSQ